MIKNYIPGSISFSDIGYGQMRSRGKTIWMEVDERKARRIIKKLIRENRKVVSAELGLDGDWGENSTEIYGKGKFHKYDSFHGSKWAAPTLIVFFDDGPSEAYGCYTEKEVGE
jgi:hypothetical protein